MESATVEPNINNHDLQTLQAMFPDVSEDHLQEVLQSNLNIDYAIDELLSNTDGSPVSSSEYYNLTSSEYYNYSHPW